MANGRVTTGFSKPKVALYSATGTTVSYASGMPLARGVEVSIEPNEPGDNNFYADNLLAETDSSIFTGGSVTLTVDGLKDEANRLIFGLPAADESGWTHYGLSQNIPFVGIGFIIRVQEEQVVSYVPVVLKKVMFAPASTSAATQEEQIDWQTQELTGTINRDDSENTEWKMVGTAQTTEAAAEAMLNTALNITNTQEGSNTPEG